MRECSIKTEVFLAMWLVTLTSLDDLAAFLATDGSVIEGVKADLAAGADAAGFAARIFGATDGDKHRTTEPYASFPGSVGGFGPDVAVVRPAEDGEGWDVFAGMPSMPMKSYAEAMNAIAKLYADSGRRWIAVERDCIDMMRLSAPGGV